MAGAARSNDPPGSITAREALLVDHHAGNTQLDRQLSEIIVGAHENVLNSSARLRHIADEIERLAASPETLPTDTAMGAAEFHRFLIAKQKEIVNIIEDAVADAAARRERLARLSYPHPDSTAT